MRLFFLIFVFPLFSQGRIICENKNDCPNWLAQLRNNNSVCTSFLVQTDLIATNLHCLPLEIRKIGASCENLIQFHFLDESGKGAEVAQCESVKYVSAPLKDKINVDLAILKLKTPVNRDYLRFSQDGFQQRTKFLIYKIDPLPTGSVVKKVECETKMNTLYNVYYSSEYSPTVALAPCEAIPGNSGSPLISTDGRVRGVLQSGGEVPFLKKSLQGVREKSRARLIVASNFSCINLDLFNYPRKNYSACDVEVGPEVQKKLEDEVSNKAFNKLQVELDAILKDFWSHFKDRKLPFNWKVVQKEPTLEEKKRDIRARFVFFPSCIISSEALQSFAQESSKPIWEMETGLPYYTMTTEVDEDLILSYPLHHEVKKVKLIANLKGWKEGNPLELKLDYLETYPFEIEKIPLEICKK